MDDKKLKAISNSLYNLVAGLTAEKSKRMNAEFANEAVQPTDLFKMYVRTLAGKIVDAPIDDAIAKWRVFDVETDQKTALEAAEKKFALKRLVSKCAKEALLYGGAAILIRVNDGTGTLDQPLNVETIRGESLVGFAVYNKTQLVPDMDSIDKDPISPTYDLPLIYKKGDVKIHRSRLAFLMGEEGPQEPNASVTADSFWGRSVLLRVIDYMRTAEAFSDCVGELAYEAKVDLFKIENLDSWLTQAGGTEVLLERFRLMNQSKSINNAMLMDASESWEQKQISFGSLDSIMKIYFLLLCAVADMPATRLFGQAASGFNATGEGDADNYRQRLDSIRNDRVASALDYVDQVLVRSTLGTWPPEYKWSWPSLEKTNDLEEAQIEKLNAETAAIYLQAGVLTEPIVAMELLGKAQFFGVTQEYVDALEGVLAINGSEPEMTPGV